MMNLTELEIEIKKIAKKINAPEQFLPTFGFTEGTARPHIEVYNNEYNYVINERGEEYERIKTNDFQELLYKVFSNVTFEMAVQHELANRINNEDFRIQLFQIQEDLLDRIDSTFSEKMKSKHDKILRR